MRLDRKSTFIAGGTSGIGLATAAAFLREGGHVAVTGRDHARLQSVVERLGDRCKGFVADAADDDAMLEALRAAASTLGGLDVLFVNAGHYVPAALGATGRADIEAQMKVVANTFMAVQSALPYLRKEASVVLMSSVYAGMGSPGAGAYAASKAACGALARSMASELAPRRIRVNVVVPGAVDTPGWPHHKMEANERDRQKRAIGERALINRMVTDAEVASAVLFLASGESSGLNASEIVVDGGTTGALAGSPRYLRGEP
jgi:NAD(P)-dependent dehydrogenase (short-subunit alcohol dehydrogenase family)